MDRDFAFVALDEAQLGADPERGHVFTDRMLHARGREETMILGSESLAPMVRALLPKAEIIGRPRFSTLSYAGATKLSRLPPRSAIVAFSAEQVYAVAEMLRRMRGGAAVVMGALSPRTRNAQVAMYQAGEVDYLVATDAIGMGLNMDVAHVAFAGLSKFDGRRRRRLTPAEMAQIAGRAGRHQRDGTFGSLTAGGGAGRRVPAGGDRSDRGTSLRAARPSLLARRRSGLAQRRGLIRSLERRPERPGLRAAPEAVDLAVLKRLAERSRGAARAAGRAGACQRLWAACGLPDFRKTGAEHHARLVGAHLSAISARAMAASRKPGLPTRSRGSTMSRAISTRSPTGSPGSEPGPISPTGPTGWPIPRRWRERTRAVEEKLSDALHERLTQRFVDRRTSVLMRDVGGKGAAEFPVIVDEQGEVAVGTYPIGRLDGFHFEVDPAARHADRKMLLATAERRLGGEYEKRAAALVADEDENFALRTDAGAAGRHAVARARGRAARPGQEFAVAAHPARPADRSRVRSAAATR